MNPSKTANELTFWEHLDVLRGCLVRVIAVTVACAVVAFLLKEQVFALLLAPKEPDFVTFRWLHDVSLCLFPDFGGISPFSVKLINTGLAQQFLIHMQASLYVGIICASPYIIYVLFRFVSPALYARERKYAYGVVGGGYVMFALGVLLNYFLIFPLTFRFLGTYQVAAEVDNFITLQSYMDTLATMSLMLGVVFEIPVVSFLLAKFGLISSAIMSRFRRHAIIAILLVAATITPTSDAFTLMLVAVPIWLLYEGSIFLVRFAHR